MSAPPFRSGLRDLDVALWGEPGVPGGSLLEIHGPSDAGKTALALWFVRTHLADPEAWAAWVPAEPALSTVNLRWAGVDPERLLLLPPGDGAPGLALAREVVEAGCPLVVVDSIAALLGSEPEVGLKQVLGDPRDGLLPLKDAAEQTGALVILTDQERSIPGSRVSYHAGACPALTRLVDGRIRLRAGEGLYDIGIRVGMRVHFEVGKNGPDMEKWHRDGRFNCYWSAGLKDLRR